MSIVSEIRVTADEVVELTSQGKRSDALAEGDVLATELDNFLHANDELLTTQW